MAIAGTPLAGQAQPAVAPPSGLAGIASAAGLTYGAAVQADLLASDGQYSTLVASECATLMPVYEAKFAALQPESGRFEFGPLDGLLAWAAAHGKIVRGHALVWHQDMPPWALASLGQGQARAREVMAAHFDRVLAHTAPSIRIWDVVNEAVADPPGSDTPQATGELRDSPWLRALGPGYVELALRVARARDPTLRLALNEYGVEEDAAHCREKRRRLLALVRRLRRAHAPLDVVGIQAHLQMSRPFSGPVFTAFCRDLRAEGVELAVTEMDVREPAQVAGDYAARDRLIAERVSAFVAAAIDGGVRTFLTWGLLDRYSWLVSDNAVRRTDGLQHRGLPLDWEGSRKPYWQAMAQAFRAAR